MAEAADDEHPPWVDLGVYAERTGQHIDAVRSAVRRGRLKARKGNDGRWLVPEPAGGALQPARGDGAGGTSIMPASAMPVPSAVLVAAVTGALAELRAVLVEARADAAEARAEASRLREELAASQLAQARAEERARTAQAGAAVKDEVLSDLRRALEHERARAGRLEALLARAWWRRLVG